MIGFDNIKEKITGIYDKLRGKPTGISVKMIVSETPHYYHVFVNEHFERTIAPKKHERRFTKNISATNISFAELKTLDVMDIITSTKAIIFEDSEFDELIDYLALMGGVNLIRLQYMDYVNAPDTLKTLRHMHTEIRQQLADINIAIVTESGFGKKYGEKYPELFKASADEYNRTHNQLMNRIAEIDANIQDVETMIDERDGMMYMLLRKIELTGTGKIPLDESELAMYRYIEM
ncbi:hypothetical protein HNP86_001767 [Methanococcus maripaludis]|uniref:Uncharacterized protein n=1 Tax=Methanococcus maripaludis TaxID=39152 RepID=A0A7J9NVB0_METMI|nr:hypothetical protein [Methanococcus maripaludis]MBA2851608.1 hypothetical protein [Methanococcus maripaludis]